MSESHHPIVEAAARGALPSWARMSEDRWAHAARVADLMRRWAEATGRNHADRTRWIAAAYLHDMLKDADERELLEAVLPAHRELPGPVLHGPAAATRLRQEGVEDRPLLDAVAWHSLGHPELETIGTALYAADFLEPGRELHEEWRGQLRGRMPDELDDVVREIVATRIRHLLERGRRIRPETIGFWNRFAGGEPWASASEL